MNNLLDRLISWRRTSRERGRLPDAEDVDRLLSESALAVAPLSPERARLIYDAAVRGAARPARASRVRAGFAYAGAAAALLAGVYAVLARDAAVPGQPLSVSAPATTVAVRPNGRPVRAGGPTLAISPNVPVRVATVVEPAKAPVRPIARFAAYSGGAGRVGAAAKRRASGPTAPDVQMARILVVTVQKPPVIATARSASEDVAGYARAAAYRPSADGQPEVLECTVAGTPGSDDRVSYGSVPVGQPGEDSHLSVSVDPAEHTETEKVP